MVHQRELFEIRSMLKRLEDKLDRRVWLRKVCCIRDSFETLQIQSPLLTNVYGALDVDYPIL